MKFLWKNLLIMFLVSAVIAVIQRIPDWDRGFGTLELARYMGTIFAYFIWPLLVLLIGLVVYIFKKHSFDTAILLAWIVFVLKLFVTFLL